MAESSQCLGSAHLMDYYEDIFKCNICLDKIKEPRMCFHCSKLYCSKCINNWLETETADGKCTHCKGCLKDKLVIIRWQDDLDKIHILKQKAKTDEGKCPLHEKPLDLFCLTCQKSICVDCLYQNQHNSHKFQNIDSVFEECLPNLKTKETEIKARLGKAKGIGQSLIQMCDEFQTAKLHALEKWNDCKTKEIADALTKIETKYQPHIDDINEQQNQFLVKLEEKKAELSKLLDAYEGIKDKMKNVMELPKFDMIEKEKELLKEVDEKLLTYKINELDFKINTTIYDL